MTLEEKKSLEFEQWIASCNTVLNLGCGSGNDTCTFPEMGKCVVVCNQSEANKIKH